ncbi:MAG: S24/S26 family peptidase [Deltaproteobacteria bacterium]|nr:S24/S26 family peptidase [Deltaproteobacteria bacterium]
MNAEHRTAEQVDTDGITRHRALCEAVAAAHAKGGTVVMRARGRSMRPMIRDGEELRIRNLGDRALRPGDVVLARTAGGAVIHRVVTIDRTACRVRLKGDGERYPDALLPISAIIGRADAVRRKGRWVSLDAPWRAVLAQFVSLHLAPRAPLRRLARRLVPSAFL